MIGEMREKKKYLNKNASYKRPRHLVGRCSIAIPEGGAEQHHRRRRLRLRQGKKDEYEIDAAGKATGKQPYGHITTRRN